MLSNFNLIKSCFGPDDDESEKFEIKRKSQYTHPSFYYIKHPLSSM